MRRFVYGVVVAVAFSAVSHVSHAVTVNLSVEVSNAQVEAAAHFITEENARITAENERRAKEEPPLPALPPIAGPKEFFEATIIPRILDSWVVKYARVTHDAAGVRQRWEVSTPAQRQAALDALAPMPTPE